MPGPPALPAEDAPERAALGGGRQRRGGRRLPEHRQDPQDKQFGAQASRDADVVDELEARGAEVSGSRGAAPRAGDKAEPVVDEGPGPQRACTAHEGHDHMHGEGCGHEAVEHDRHLDYLHDGHRHAAHAGHWDDH